MVRYCHVSLLFHVDREVNAICNSFNLIPHQNDNWVDGWKIKPIKSHEFQLAHKKKQKSISSSSWQKIDSMRPVYFRVG